MVIRSPLDSNFRTVSKIGTIESLVIFFALSIQLQTVEVDSTWDRLPILALSIPVNGILSTTINARLSKSYFHLSDQLSTHIIKGWKTQLSEKDKQIDELLKQQDQSQQIIAMQQKNLDRLTEQNQLLIEASQKKEEKKVGFWGQLIGQRA